MIKKIRRLLVTILIVLAVGIVVQRVTSWTTSRATQPPPPPPAVWTVDRGQADINAQAIAIAIILSVIMIVIAVRAKHAAFVMWIIGMPLIGIGWIVLTVLNTLQPTFRDIGQFFQSNDFATLPKVGLSLVVFIVVMVGAFIRGGNSHKDEKRNLKIGLVIGTIAAIIVLIAFR